jgi:hypothetical protein
MSRAWKNHDAYQHTLERLRGAHETARHADPRLARMRHEGCGDRAGKVELITGIEGASSRPVRKIVLVDRTPN